MKQGNSAQALKMYRMALDQIPNTNKRLRVRVMHNIALTLASQSKLDEAVQTLESILDIQPQNYLAGCSLISLYCKQGEIESMHNCFKKLVSMPCPQRLAIGPDVCTLFTFVSKS